MFLCVSTIHHRLKTENNVVHASGVDSSGDKPVGSGLTMVLLYSGDVINFL